LGLSQNPASLFAHARLTLFFPNHSCSVIEFNWCLDKEVPNLLHHNVFLSGDYKGSWDRPAVIDDFAAPKQHNFYCHNPVYTDKTSAPSGGASIMVLLPVANLNEQKQICKKKGLPVPNEEDMVNAARKAVLRRFKEAGTDIEQNIVAENITTPTEWQQRFNIKVSNCAFPKSRPPYFTEAGDCCPCIAIYSYQKGRLTSALTVYSYTLQKTDTFR
jgi:phytoene dehydrogenase-like protein